MQITINCISKLLCDFPKKCIINKFHISIRGQFTLSLFFCNAIDRLSTFLYWSSVSMKSGFWQSAQISLCFNFTIIWFFATQRILDIFINTSSYWISQIFLLHLSKLTNQREESCFPYFQFSLSGPNFAPNSEKETRVRSGVHTTHLPEFYQ